MMVEYWRARSASLSELKGKDILELASGSVNSGYPPYGFHEHLHYLVQRLSLLMRKHRVILIDIFFTVSKPI